jgi:YfiH family protein
MEPSQRPEACSGGQASPTAALHSGNREGLPVYEFDHLAAFGELEHGITTRRGGYSTTPFQELNLALGVGDDPAAVARNRRRVFRRFAGRPVLLRQVHGVRVVTVARKDAGLVVGGGPPPTEGDALITDVPGVALTVLVADCQAVLLYDPVRGVVGNVHSGWRGSVGNIIGAAVGAMAARFGCRPEDIRAGVGPSLGPCCAEFIHYRRELPPAFWDYRVGARHFDFWAASFDQLTTAGLRPERIRISRVCSRCRSGEFFSYRAARITGRFAAVIGLR